MKVSLVIPTYIEWHYSGAVLNMWGILTNFVWFLYNFFSVPILWKTLFAPWHTPRSAYTNDLNIFLDVLLRAVGFVIRAAFLILVFSIIAALVFGGIIFFILWFLAPLILFLLFIASVRYFSI